MRRSCFHPFLVLAFFGAWPAELTAQPHLYAGDGMVDILDLQSRENGARTDTADAHRGEQPREMLRDIMDRRAGCEEGITVIVQA